MERVKKIQNRVREGSPIATAAMYAASALLVLACVYPMYYVLILSLSAPEYAITMHVYTVPKGFSLDSYRMIAGNPQMWRTFANSVLYVVSTTVLMLIISIVSAFPLTFKGLAGRKYLNMYFLITMFFGGGLIPSFLVVTKLGMYNSPLALIIPSCFSVWNMILCKAYLSTIPESLREAARIDGAGVFQIFSRIYAPLATPILAVIAVYTIVGVWNSWFSAMVYLPSQDWQPLQMFLRRMLVDNQSPGQMLMPEEYKLMMERKMAYAQLKYAMIIFTSLPVLFTYPFFQKYFIKGIMLGSLKE
jgi:putative aldouronate transport system permease protein